MYKLIQRKKKLLLAIFGVLLMIVFVLPIGMNQMQYDPSTVVYGRVGDAKVTQGDVQQARNDIDVLIDARFGPLLQLGEMMSFGQPSGRVASGLREKPITYALLQREAREAGVSPSPEAVQELFELYFQNPGQTISARDAAGYRAAIERFLLVRDHYQRVLADIKVTVPQVQNAIVQRQRPTLNVMEIQASEFLDRAQEPTEQQIVTHYNRYAEVAPAPAFSFAATQPVQFGYRQGDKVKLQYLELPAAELTAAAMKVIKPADLLPLDRVAFAYYSANPNLFQTTPATLPTTSATGPSTQSATAPAATAPAQPTTRPFAEARNEIRQKILMNEASAPTAPAEDVVAAQMLRQKVEARADEIRNALRERLAKDFKEASAAKDLARIEKVDYLEKVADDFQKSHGLRPVVKSLATDFLSVTDLAALPGINSATANAEAFPQIATKHADDITPAGPEAPKTQPTTAPTTGPATTPATGPATAPAEEAGATVTVKATPPAKPALALLEPSPLLRDPLGNTYLFRLTAFNGAHVPSLEEARPMIIKDLKLVGAFDLARKEAVKLRDAAGSAAGNSKIGGLPVVGTGVKEIGPIDLDPRRPEIPGYDLTDPTVQQALVPGLFRVLQNAKADVPHPSTVVDMPSKQKVLVLELRSYELAWTTEEDARMQTQMISIARSQLMQEPSVQDALADWFDADAVANRTGFKMAE